MLARLAPHSDDSYENTSSLEEDFSPSDPGIKRLETAHRAPIAEEYERAVMAQMKEDLLQVDELVVFVSHPDKDHYNKIPKIFDEEFMGRSTHDHITFVMSGFPSQYTESDAERWIRNMETKRGVRFLFTGTQDGTGAETAGNIQRAYRSSDEAHSPLEQSLVALTTHIESTYGLKTDILSMNANIDEETRTIAAAKTKKNTNSMILRFALMDEGVEVKDTSILIPGDAEGPTWAHAMQPYMVEIPSGVDVSDISADATAAAAAPPLAIAPDVLDTPPDVTAATGASLIGPDDDDLDAPSGATAAIAAPLAIGPDNVKVTHMILSHHGSSTNDSLTGAVLDFFQPQTLFMSNGRNTSFKHPSIIGVNTISDYLKRHPSLVTEGHYLSYHKITGPKGLPYRTWTTAPVFATLNSGTITIRLHEKPSTIQVSRNRPQSSPAPDAASADT